MGFSRNIPHPSLKSGAHFSVGKSLTSKYLTNKLFRLFLWDKPLLCKVKLLHLFHLLVRQLPKQISELANLQWSWSLVVLKKIYRECLLRRQKLGMDWKIRILQYFCYWLIIGSCWVSQCRNNLSRQTDIQTE